MVLDLIKFLSKLNKNNDKRWFDKNREEYKNVSSEFNEFVGQMLYEIACFDNRIRDVSPKECVFRINRDIRFSNDKTPYKTYLSGVIAPGGKKMFEAGFYFQINYQGQLFFGGGEYQPDSKKLLKIRKEIQEDSETLRKILKEKKFLKIYQGLDDLKVKTAPKGFSKDDPDLDLLKYKSFTVFSETEIGNMTYEHIKNYLLENFELLFPLVNWLRNAVE